MSLSGATWRTRLLGTHTLHDSVGSNAVVAVEASRILQQQQRPLQDHVKKYGSPDIIQRLMNRRLVHANKDQRTVNSKVLERMVERLKAKNNAEAIRMLESQTHTSTAKVLTKMSAVNAAKLLEQLKPQHAAKVLESMQTSAASSIVSTMSSSVAGAILEHVSSETAATLIKSSGDDIWAAQVLSQLSDGPQGNKAKAILSRMPAHEAANVEKDMLTTNSLSDSALWVRRCVVGIVAGMGMLTLMSSATYAVYKKSGRLSLGPLSVQSGGHVFWRDKQLFLTHSQQSSYAPVFAASDAEETEQAAANAEETVQIEESHDFQASGSRSTPSVVRRTFGRIAGVATFLRRRPVTGNSEEADAEVGREQEATEASDGADGEQEAAKTNDESHQQTSSQPSAEEEAELVALLFDQEKRLQQLSQQRLQRRRVMLNLCMFAYSGTCIAIPFFQAAGSASCSNGFYWESHIPICVVFSVTKMYELFLYVSDPCVTGELDFFNFMLKFVPSIIGFADGYTDAMAIIIAQACDSDFSKSLASWMLGCFLLGVVFTQWLVLWFLTRYDPSQACLMKLLHMDAAAACVTFPTEVKWLWVSVNVARTLAEDIPQCILQSLFLIYVKKNPFMMASVLLGFATSVKAVYDATRRASYARSSLLKLREEEEARKQEAYKNALQPKLAPKLAPELATPLAEAAWNGNARSVEDLLSRGAPPNTEAYDGFAHSRHSAVNGAARNGHAKILQMLLEQPVRPDIESRGPEPWSNTPLQQAAIFGHDECAKILLLNGASTTPKAGKAFKYKTARAIAKQSKKGQWQEVIALIDDCAERGFVSATDPNGSGVRIQQWQEVGQNPRRGSTRMHSIEVASNAYERYALEINSINSGETFQLGRVQLKDMASRDIKFRGVSINDARCNGWDQGQFRNLIQDNRRKWCAQLNNFPNRVPRIEFTLHAPTKVGVLALTSANDRPECDPSGFTLFGVMHRASDAGPAGSTMKRKLAQQLSEAAWKGDCNRVQELLHQGASPSSEVWGGFHHGASALNAAARNGHAQIVQLLLEQPIIPDIESRGAPPWEHTPLQEASCHGHAECARMLLLHFASTKSRSGKGGGQKTAEELAEQFKSGQWQEVIAAIKESQAGLSDWLASYPVSGGPRQDQLQAYDWFDKTFGGARTWPLQRAAMRGEVDTIKHLCRNGQNPNVKMLAWYDSEPLGWAASFGQLGAVIALIQLGADPLLPPNKAGNTPLTDAQRERHSHVVSFLQEYEKRKRAFG